MNLEKKTKNLFLKAGGLKGEQELLDVILPQLINAARIDGTAKELVYLILRMKSLLCTAAGGSFDSSQCCMCVFQ